MRFSRFKVAALVALLLGAVVVWSQQSDQSPSPPGLNNRPPVAVGSKKFTDMVIELVETAQNALEDYQKAEDAADAPKSQAVINLENELAVLSQRLEQIVAEVRIQRQKDRVTAWVWRIGALFLGLVLKKLWDKRKVLFRR